MESTPDQDEGATRQGSPRHVFISASFLHREFRAVPPEVMQSAIFFFGSKRSWGMYSAVRPPPPLARQQAHHIFTPFDEVFPENERERKESLRQPTRYYAFPEDFKQLILEKEKVGLLYWLKPDQDYRKVSAFLEQIVDPVTGQLYAPLILDEQWWKQTYDRSMARSCPPPDSFRVIHNYKLGDHDYAPTMELLVQSNHNLIPVLSWSDHAKK